MSATSRRPSTSSLMTTTMEEKEVTAMLNDISDVEDDDDLKRPPSSSSSPSKSSSDGMTDDRGVRAIPGWDSDLTDLSSGSESDMLSDPESDPDSLSVKPHGTGLTIRIPLLVNRLPPDVVARKCGNKRCNIALPKDYRWKTCGPCRRAQRTYQRVRLENKRRKVLGIGKWTWPWSCVRLVQRLVRDVGIPRDALSSMALSQPGHV